MKLIHINVKDKTINSEEIQRDSDYFLLGARGITSQIVFDEVNPTSDPLGKENKLIIASGLLTGTPFPNSARTSIGAKSPLTGGIKEANVGGRSSYLLARHGIRALVLEDISDEMQIIIVDGDDIKLETAEEYRGLGNYELQEKLLKRYGEKAGIYSIGPAGEHMMKAASIASTDMEGYPSRHAARGGLGAVMGSKGIKAVVVTPPKGSKVNIQDIDKFKEFSVPFTKELAKTKETFSIYGTPLLVIPMNEYGALPTKDFKKGSFEQAEKISGEKVHEIVESRGGKKRLPCSPMCAIRCSNMYLDENGEHLTSSFEYETIALNGSNLTIEELDDLAKLDHLCDDTGIDTIEFGGTMGVAMESGEIQWGNAEQVFEIIEEIRKGTEKGNLYGNGVRHLAQNLGTDRVPEIKGQGIPGYDPRVFKGMSITFATSPMGADHTAGAAVAGRKARQDKEYGGLKENDHKLELSYELQVYTTVLDSLGCCYFIGPSYENMELIANVLNAMHGLDLTREDVINIGKHILRTELQFNNKAGITQETNDVPEFFKKEPSEPTGLKFTFDEKNLREFWDRLEQ